MPIDRSAEIEIRAVEDFHRKLTNFASYIEAVKSNLNTPNYESLANIPFEVKALNDQFAKVAALNIAPARYRKILEFHLLYEDFSDSAADFDSGMAKANALRQFIKVNAANIPMTTDANEKRQWVSAPQPVLDQISAQITEILGHYVG